MREEDGIKEARIDFVSAVLGFWERRDGVGVRRYDESVERKRVKEGLPVVRALLGGGEESLLGFTGPILAANQSR